MNNKDLYQLVIEYFSEIQDHRVNRTKIHSMFTIIFIVIFGLACGVKSWIGFADNALLNKDWLLNYLKIDSLPSKDTIARFIRTVDPVKMNECFMNMVNDFVTSLKGLTVPIDGKTIRSAFKNAEKKNGIHLVTAWCSELGLCLGQTRTEDKSNEISAIPLLIDMIKVKEAVITIDAIGCQSEIIDDISKKNCDFCVALKKNQSNLFESAKLSLDNAFDNKIDLPENCFFKSNIEKAHGRIETRTCVQIPSKFVMYDTKKWKHIKSFIMVESNSINNKGENTSMRRYFISSLDINAENALTHIRSHWAIESMHWQLDVVYKEDNNPIHAKRAAENLNILSKFVLATLRRVGKNINLSGPRMQRYVAHPSQIALREKVLFGIPLTMTENSES